MKYIIFKLNIKGVVVMKKFFIGGLVVLSVLLTGCSEEEAQKVNTETPKAADTTEEVKTTETEVTEEKTTEEESAVVSEEVINEFLSDYQDLTDNSKDSKQIAENIYQTMDLGEEFDTYTTWKFTSNEAQPEKIFEKKIAKNAGGAGFPRKSSDIADSFRVDDGFYVIEPLVSFDEETVNVIKNGSLPFSDLRLGMTEEEAAQILPNPYEIVEYDSGLTWFKGIEASYYVDGSTGLVTYIAASAEAFSDKQTLEEIKTVLGEPKEEGPYDEGEATYYDFVLGDYEYSIIRKNGDDDWQTLQITKYE